MGRVNLGLGVGFKEVQVIEGVIDVLERNLERKVIPVALDKVGSVPHQYLEYGCQYKIRPFPQIIQKAKRCHFFFEFL